MLCQKVHLLAKHLCTILCLLPFPCPFPACQVDCPDDVASYIHRVGRTARYTASGRSLLLLTPSEKAMLPRMEAAKIPFQLTKVSHWGVFK